MEYSNKILYQVDYINSLLKGYNEETIFNNKNFMVDEMSSEYYLKITYKKTDKISFDLVFSPYGFQINIDRTNEALDLGSSDFSKNKSLVKDFLDFLFTCNVKVKYCGSNYTKIYFIDRNNKCVKTLKYVTGLYLKIGCTIKEYQSIYSK